MFVVNWEGFFPAIEDAYVIKSIYRLLILIIFVDDPRSSLHRPVCGRSLVSGILFLVNKAALSCRCVS